MGLTDLLKGERGLFALALTAASTVLTALGHMTIQAWQEFNLYIYGMFVFGKTATTMTGLIKGGAVAAAPASAADTAPATEPAPAPAAPAAEPAKE